MKHINNFEKEIFKSSRDGRETIKLGNVKGYIASAAYAPGSEEIIVLCKPTAESVTSTIYSIGLEKGIVRTIKILSENNSKSQ